MGRAVGLDFATTTSDIRGTVTDGSVSLANFNNGNDISRTIKSVIYFSHRDKKHRDSTAPFIGAEAIEQYLEAEIKGRLLQSVKSYLPSRLFSQTQIFGRNYSLEELI